MKFLDYVGLQCLLWSWIWGSTTACTERSEKQLAYFATDFRGSLVPSLDASLSVQPRGPILLQDMNFLEMLGHLDRERIPERIAHAKGAGAYGYFTVTNPLLMGRLTKARVFNTVAPTKVLVRFSTVAGELGSSDNDINGARGFAIKFYTEEGNYDLLGLNTPNFPINDPLLFPSLIHALKKNPTTNLQDSSASFDFLSLRTECALWLLNVYKGIPDGYRFMDGFGVHTFVLVNAAGIRTLARFRWKTDQGIRYLSRGKAGKLDVDYATRDLFLAIAHGNYPTWSFQVQFMDESDMDKQSFDPFDITQIWPEEKFPLHQVGKLVLNRNQINFFSEVEQSAFDPGNMVPGIEAHHFDRMLQGRIFSYSDAQRYRLGVNFEQLPVNRPIPNIPISSYLRGGQGMLYNFAGPNYFPNTFGGPVPSGAGNSSVFKVSGYVTRVDRESFDTDHFNQARREWNENFTESHKNAFIDNIAFALSSAIKRIQKQTLNNLIDKISSEAGHKIRLALQQMSLEDPIETSTQGSQPT